MHAPLRPLLSAMTMEQLEALDATTLARMGLWRSSRPRPALLGQAFDQHRRSIRNAPKAAARRRMLR